MFVLLTFLQFTCLFLFTSTALKPFSIACNFHSHADSDVNLTTIHTTSMKVELQIKKGTTSSNRQATDKAQETHKHKWDH